jgi:hypothetical protein
MGARRVVLALIITLGSYMAARPLPSPRTRDTKRPPGAQTGDELPFESAAALDVERLIDRFVADRIDSSSGKSTGSRFAICSGLQDVAHRRS